MVRDNWASYRIYLVGNYGTDLALRREINRFLVTEDPYGWREFVRYGMTRGELRDDLDADADSVLVLRNSGPLGGPGMPEWGMLPVPKKLLKQGVRDMVRISDARMSGTSYGTCVLHVAPESFVGGPLALVKDGDVIELEAEKNELNLKISEQELQKRKAAWRPAGRKFERGYGILFSQHIKQANEGCDFDFLEGTARVPEPEIH